MITEAPVEGDVPLVAAGRTADVYVDADDHAVAGIAAEDLCADVGRVTGTELPLTESLDAVDDVAVVVGTLGRSAGVEACLSTDDGEVDALRDRRESYRVETVRDPVPGIESCVVVAGSDRRGTAYGVYDLARAIGVSPWYWWADVAPTSREVVAVEAGSYEGGPPSVTYRGIFLNDEDFGLRPWATETHAPTETDDRPGIGPSTYERLFELLLRLKANAVWPAMHPGTTAFYRYPEHAALADRYAIVVGTSHCEPMHRNNVDEWDEERVGEWSYVENRERIREYWRERVEDVADNENLFTVGMRSVHDGGMPDGDARAEKVDVLRDVIDDQRTMLSEAHDRAADAVPQVFCPYKEVLDLFRAGLDVPEDVCVLWPDDNFGYLRELPTPAERERSGGHGIYYHLSYWGRPHDYLWQSTVPPGLANRELTRAYEVGARECWVVNVGDVKPAEKEMEYVLDLAWDVDGVGATSTREWLERWAAREFGPERAGDVADVLCEYYRLSQARKPEHMGWSTVYPDTEPDDPAFSLVHGGDEARERVETFADLDARATEIHDALPEADRPSFYELVVYPVRTAAAASAKHLHALRSRRYAGQGRVTAEEYGERARRAHDRIVAETRYYNERLLDGKWEGVLSCSPRDLPVFDEPRTASVDARDGPALGVLPEGAHEPVRESDVHPPSLPAFDRRLDRPRFLDLFARGTEPVAWAAEQSDDWIELSRDAGTLEGELRLAVDVDWPAVPDDGATGTVTVLSRESRWGYGSRKEVRVVANVVRETDASFAVVDGTAAMEAEHATRRSDGDRARWVAGKVPGRVSGSTVAVAPAVFESYDAETGEAPRLEFDVDVPAAGPVAVDVYCVPTQPLDETRDLRYALELGRDRRVESVDPAGGETDPEWQQNVLAGAAVGTTRHDIPSDGAYALTLEALDPGLVVDRVVVRTDPRDETYLGPRETRIVE